MSGRRPRRNDQHQHVPDEKTREKAHQHLSRWQKRRILFWGWLTHYAEAKWLEANGWTPVRNGWLLPEWHPHKSASLKETRFDRIRSVEQMSFAKIREPYDQNHASNSQRYHLSVAQKPPPKRYMMMPKYPAYVRWLPYQLLDFAVTMVLAGWAYHTGGQTRTLFCVATTVTALVGLALARKVQKDLELDYSESKLRGMK